MAKRTHSLVFIVTAVLASALATLAGVATTTGTADACTPVGPPELTVQPSSDLAPGQPIVVTGRNFVTIVHTPSDPNQPTPPCEFEFRPMVAIVVTWSGPGLTQVLAAVDGYDFQVEVRVPDGATKGPAVIAAGGITAAVNVGPTEDPCPLVAAAARRADCPGPCAYAAADQAQAIGCPCPAATGTGGTTPGVVVPSWCPDPCPLPARNVVGPGLPCPDPCVYPAAGQAQAAPRCPDPCVYPAGSEKVALWCPDPCLIMAPGAQWCEPCPVNLAGGAATSGQPARPCPDPCAASAERATSGQAPAVAVWCPPVVTDVAPRPGRSSTGSSTAGSGTAGSSTAGSGIAGSGTAGSGTAGSGTAGSGTAGSGTASSGAATTTTTTTSTSAPNGAASSSTRPGGEASASTAVLPAAVDASRVTAAGTALPRPNAAQVEAQSLHVVQSALRPVMRLIQLLLNVLGR